MLDVCSTGGWAFIWRICYDPLDPLVEFIPAFLKEIPVDDPPCHVKFGFLRERAGAQIHRLGLGLRLRTAPRLAPKPADVQTLDRPIAGDKVGKILVQV